MSRKKRTLLDAHEKLAESFRILYPATFMRLARKSHEGAQRSRWLLVEKEEQDG